MTAKKYLQQCAARTEKFIITKMWYYIHICQMNTSRYFLLNRLKTVNKEHFISLELSNRKDNTSVLCADYDVWLEITQALIPNTHIDYGHRWCHVSRIYFVFYDWEVQKATVTWNTQQRHNKKC